MKKEMIFSVLASFALISHAQELTFESSLTTEDEFAKWSVIDANNDTKTWGFDSGTTAAKYSYSSNNVADDWLVSPAIAAPNGSYILSFDYQGSSYGEKMDIFYGSQSTAEALTQPIADLGTFTVNGEFASTKQMFKVEADGNIHIGFHAKSDPDKFRILVKNVKLVPAQGLDAQAVSVTTTESGDNLATEPIVLTVRNSGTTDISNLKVCYQVNSNPVVTETITTTIKPGESVEHTFATKADMTESGLYTIKAWTALENDEIPENDLCETSTRHYGPASVPYFNGFEDAYSREAIKFFNLNEDPEDDKNGKWSIFKNEGFTGYFSRSGDYSMIYWYSKNNPGDDWFILEPIKLKAGYYSLKFWYATFNEHNERFAVYYGTEATPEAMTNLVVKYDPFMSDPYLESANVIHIEQDGIYYIGFHSFSDKDENLICIDDISLEEIPDVKPDLTISNVTSPANGYVRPDQTQDVLFAVTNNSIVDLENTTVSVEIDGKEVSNISIDYIAAQETIALQCEDALKDLALGKHQLKITLSNEEDQMPDNNVCSIEFKKVQDAAVMYDFENDGKVPEDLTLRVNDNGTVHSSISDIFPNNEAWAPIEIEPSERYGSWLLASGSYFTEDIQADRWCIFPKMSVKSENADLIWTANSGDMGKRFPESYEVLVSTTDMETESFTAVATIGEETYADAPSTRGVDLSAYNGKDIHVAFRLTTHDGYFLTIDNVGFYGDIEKAGASGIENVINNEGIIVDGQQVTCIAENVESISIYDASGRLVAGNRNSASIGISQLANGVYIVRAVADGKTLQGKFIK